MYAPLLVGLLSLGGEAAWLLSALGEPIQLLTNLWA